MDSALSLNAASDAGDVRRADYRLIIPAGCAWLGVACGLWSLPAPIFFGALLILVGIGLFIWRGALYTVISVAFVSGVGFVCGWIQLTAFENDPAANLPAKYPTVLEVELTSDPQRRETKWGTTGSWQADATIVSVAGEPSSAGVLLRGSDLEELSRWDKAEVFGDLRKGFRDSPPDVGVFQVRSVRNMQEVTGVGALSNRIRDTFQTMVARYPDYAASLIPGMAVGDLRQMDKSLRDAMIATSLVHLTAVSGAHLSMALGVLGAIIPGGRVVRAVVAVAFAALLVCVVGPSPSVLRASIMCGVTSWGLAGRRKGQPQSTLALVVLVCVLGSPWMAIEYGFALSVLATFGLLFSGRHLIKKWRVENKIAKFFVEAGVITLAAQLWALPVLVTLDDSLPILSPLANILVAPAVMVVTVLGMAAAAAVIPFPGLAELLCLLAVPFAGWIDFVARELAGWSISRLPWFTGIIGIVCAALLICLVVVWQVRSEAKA